MSAVNSHAANLKRIEELEKAVETLMEQLTTVTNRLASANSVLPLGCKEMIESARWEMDQIREALLAKEAKP